MSELMSVSDIHGRREGSMVSSGGELELELELAV